MAVRVRNLIIFLVVACTVPCPLRGADYATTASGNWSSAATWVTNGPPGITPGAGDNAYISSNYPSGGSGILNPVVTLAQNESASSVYLGFTNGSFPTLDLNGHVLTASNFYFGYGSGTTPVLQRTGGGTIAVSSYLQTDNGNTLSLVAGDQVSNANVFGGSTLTTADTGNLTSSMFINGGSTVNAGANVSLSGDFRMDQGTLNMNLKSLASATNVFLGYFGGTPTVNARGSISTPNLYIGNLALNLTAADSVTNFTLTGTASTTFATGVTVSGLSVQNGAMATTATTGSSVTGSVFVAGGGTINLQASLNLSGDFRLDQGTLNMNLKSLTSASNIFLGWFGGTPTVSSRGDIHTPNLLIGNLALNLTAADSVTNFSLAGSASTVFPAGVSVSGLTVQGGATATTASAGNSVTGNVTIVSSGTLNLQGNMSLSGDFRMDQGTLNMNLKSLASATNVFLGYFGGTPTVNARGSISTPNLYIGNLALNLTAADSVTNFTLTGTASTTFATGVTVSGLSVQNGAMATTGSSVTGSVFVAGGGTINLQASLNLSGDFRLDQGTLNMGNNSLTSATNVFIGYYGGSPTVSSRGSITTPNLYIGNLALNLTANDHVTNFTATGSSSTTFPSTAAVSTLSLLSGATATTTAIGNVTAGVTILNGGALTLGADMSLSGDFRLDAGTLNMGGRSLSATNVFYGWYGGPASLASQGNTNATNLYLGSGFSFPFLAGDAAANLYVYGNAAATTASTGNVTGSVNIVGGSLTLGANMTLAGVFRVDTGTFNAAGRNLTANTIYFGYFAGPAAVQNLGVLRANTLLVGNTSTARLVSGADVIGSVNISTAGIVHVVRTPIASGGGLTLTDSGTSALSIAAGSKLELEFPDALGNGGWAFRWQNPTGGNHIADINALIAGGQIVLQTPNGFTPLIQSLADGYTYVGVPVPEPSLMLLAALPFARLCAVRRRGDHWRCFARSENSCT